MDQHVEVYWNHLYGLIDFHFRYFRRYGLIDLHFRYLSRRVVSFYWNSTNSVYQNSYKIYIQPELLVLQHSCGISQWQQVGIFLLTYFNSCFSVLVALCVENPQVDCRQVSNIRLTLVGNKIFDHSDVVGASPIGAAPTTSSFST